VRAWVAVLFLASTARAGSPADAVVAALADARRSPEARKLGYRYLWLGAIPEKKRADFQKALAFQCNSLSREAEIALPVSVAPDLVRISLLDYEMPEKVWEKLKDVDPYFHARIVEQEVEAKITEVVEEVEVGHWHLNVTGEIVDRKWANDNPRRVWWEKTGTIKERRQVKREGKKARVITSSAPWLPAKESGELATYLGTECPIVRADWWLVWTAIQKGRKGSGYYDFLGLKSRADAEKLAALDVAAAKRVRKEIAALVAESGVAINNRQILRYQSLTGGYWFTLDSNESVAKNNALSLLDADYKHDAEEIYFVLPNGLFGLVASNANGELQETVPDSIAGDHASTNNDRRIHPGLSCVRCHVEGLRPIDDWARSVYQGPENPDSPVKLTSVDPIKLKRLRQLYLAPLKKHLEKDRDVYGEALKTVNGLTAAENAKVYAAAWSAYQETSLDVGGAADELGVNKEALLRALRGYGSPGNADPIMISLLAGRKIRREHFEERVAQFYQVLVQYGGK